MERDLEFEAPIAATEQKIAKLRAELETGKPVNGELVELEKQLEREMAEIYGRLTPWQVVQIARHPRRPVLQDYLNLIFEDFIELHGDRAFSDDLGLVGGFARLGAQRVMVIGHNKGKNVDENVARNFGMALPDGYRKALRLMRLAEKFGLPVITFVDTPGAFPGVEAEERGQAEAIARNIHDMALLEVPIVSLVTGEGGSGGALGIAVGNDVLMLEYSIYSVISPEGCASILWRDAAHSPEAAEALKLTAPSLLSFGLIDEIIPEPPGGAHHDPVGTAHRVRDVLSRRVQALVALSPAEITEQRFQKFAKMGAFQE